MNLVMVDVSAKKEVFREAIARGIIKLRPETVKLIKTKKIAKGDPLYSAKIAGILGAKKTSEIVVLCHPLPLDSIDVETNIVNDSIVEVVASVKTKAQTGVEMEALTAVSTALLTIWDMTKQYEKDSNGQYPFTVINNISVLKKIKDDKL